MKNWIMGLLTTASLIACAIFYLSWHDNETRFGTLERLTNERDGMERLILTAESHTWQSYREIIVPIVTAARYRRAHPELPQPDVGAVTVTVVGWPASSSDGQGEVFVFFPEEAAIIRSADAALEADYRVLARVRRGVCRPLNHQSLEVRPFEHFDASLECHSQEDRFGDLDDFQIRPLLPVTPSAVVVHPTSESEVGAPTET